jgi:hypothetical protein
VTQTTAVASHEIRILWSELKGGFDIREQQQRKLLQVLSVLLKVIKASQLVIVHKSQEKVVTSFVPID